MKPPGGYAADADCLAADILRHLAEIGAGRTSITDADLAGAPSDVMRELLVGLLTLHEDLEYERGLRASAEQQSDRLVTDLRAAVAARDEFLSVASHELRTPLSTLKLQTTTLARWLGREGQGGRESALTKQFAVIERQVTRLEKLMADLLDVSRITSGRLELHREPVDLVVLVREIVDRFRADRVGSAPVIVFESDESVAGEWDPFRLEQVASNLVTNAIRYGEGTPIHVSVRGTGDAARLVVKDEGIGIAADQKQRIFERFERAVSSANYGGLGLGLWIAKQVVDAHEGGIDVDSEPGQGATFTVTLPRRAGAHG
ncbi:MAG TPA: HAMP domain-containing sensor histidine kinase [Vicinamibacterales bacterium]|nr:HAMP domain-containing sensor histidine kinase [Vicinamibacterales bacterium]